MAKKIGDYTLREIHDMCEAYGPTCAGCIFEGLETCGCIYSMSDKYLNKEPAAEKWRPFNDVDELVFEFKTRFDLVCPDVCMPLIWVRSKIRQGASLITVFYDGGVQLGEKSAINNCTLKELFTNYTFLDGSPCGMKE